ncbi:MAG: site-specific integrase [Kiloniellales bacterium]
MAKKPPRLRTRKGKEQRHRDTSGDPETERRRRSTANRVLTTLKAALNHAFEDRDDIKTDIAWRKVKPFRGVDAARIRYLKVDEARELVKSARPALAWLIRGALATGCRYGELVKMKVADFNPDTGMIHVAESKSGKARWVVLTSEGVETFRGMVLGKADNDSIFVKDDGSRWGKSHQTRPLLEANEAAEIDPPADFHCLRHTYASHAVMGAMPLIVLARNLGHSDTRMVDKHYGHMADDWAAHENGGAIIPH